MRLNGPTRNSKTIKCSCKNPTKVGATINIINYLSETRGISLSPQQQAAVLETEGHILLLAVPGAGKTTVVTARLGNLILGKGVPPERTCTLTFNREAARDMEARWQELFGEMAPAPPISTIHSFCYRLLREYAADRGTRVPDLLEEGARVRILSQLYQQQTGKFLTDELRGDLDNFMGYCVNMRLTQAEAQAATRDEPDLWPMWQAYTNHKRQNQLMDFDDMLLFAYTALTRSDALRQRLTGRYDYIHLDEAQDTSKIQHDILRLIVRDNLLMVGDEDQSIYGFRGAWPQGLMSFFETFAGGKRMLLEENYRSTGTIVEGAAKVIETSGNRYAKAMHTSHPRGEEIVVEQSVTMEEEYSWVAERLRQLPAGETCGVLYRTGCSGLAMAHLLLGQGVPFVFRGGNLGYAGDFINRDVFSIMQLAADPSDSVAFRRCYFRLGCIIPREVANSAIEAAPKDILGWIVDYSDYPGKNTGTLSWTRRVLDAMKHKLPQEQLQTILGDLGYITGLEKRGQDGYRISACLQKLVLLRQLAEGARSVQELVERVGTAEAKARQEGRAAVTLTTVHSAKGREFDHVFILDAVEGIFPAADAVEYRALHHRQQLDEETRLFYTAMTRARSHLTIVAPSSALGRSLGPSRLLQPLTGGTLLGDRALYIGMKVSHTYFGIGEIVGFDLRRGWVEILFRTGGKKTFDPGSLLDPRTIQII